MTVRCGWVPAKAGFSEKMHDGKLLKESFWLIPLLEQQDWAAATRLWKVGKTKNVLITFLSQRRERVVLLAVQI